MLRVCVHFTLNAIGVTLWLLSMALMWGVLRLSIIGRWIWPEADHGNCWTYALPRWHREGGYLAVCITPLRWRGVQLRVPHAIWVPGSLLDVPLHQTLPVKKQSGLLASWFGLKTIYFKYSVIRFERQAWRWRGSAADPGFLHRLVRRMLSGDVIDRLWMVALLVACGLLVCAAVASVFISLAGPLDDPAGWLRRFTAMPFSGGR